MSKQSFRILNARIINFKGIGELEAPINGRSVWLIGGNSHDKTSVLQSIWCVLTGKGWPPNPIKKGEAKAQISVVVGNQERNLTVNCSITKKDKYLTIHNEQGNPVAKGAERTFLESLMAPYTIEPFKFINMKPDEQAKIVKAIAGINTDIIQEEFDRIYKERTDVNREVKRHKALVDSFLKAYPDFENYKKSVTVNAEQIQDELAKVRAKLSTIRDIETKTSDFNNMLQNTLASVRRNADRIEQLQNEILALTQKTDQLLNEAAVAEESVTKGTTWLEGANKAHWEESEKKLANDLVLLAQNAKKDAEYDNFYNAYEEQQKAEADSEAKTTRLKELEQQKMDIIKSANIPVEGLTYTDEGLLYKGVPYDENQIARNEMLKVAILLNIAQLSQVEAIRLPDASLMDKHTREALQAVIEEKGYQAFWELVDDDGGDLEIRYSEEEGIAEAPVF
jgi:hypothetical protein